MEPAVTIIDKPGPTRKAGEIMFYTFLALIASVFRSVGATGTLFVGRNLEAGR
jgi:hypothetical protein